MPINAWAQLSADKLLEPYVESLIDAEQTDILNKTSGTASAIESVSLTYFSSTDCSTGAFLPGFTTTAGPVFPVTDATPFGLNASSAYQVAVAGTPGIGQISNIQSLLLTLTTEDSSSAVFTGSCASQNGNCCVPVSCSTGPNTCTGSIDTQNFVAPGALISVSGSPLLLSPGTTSSLVVTNTSSVTTATNVTATLPVSLSDVTQDASACTSLAPLASCNLSLIAGGTTYDATLFSVAGTNTDTVPATLTVARPAVANGAVNALVQDIPNHRIYLGGAFTSIGPRTGGGVPIDTSTGLPLSFFSEVNGTVKVVIADGTGGRYIGGIFSAVNGIARNNIAHINGDETLDLGFNPNANGEVNALLLNGTTLYVGGDFSSIAGVVRERITALDTTAVASATAFNPGVQGASFISALEVNGTIVYAGGTFTSMAVAPNSNFAILAQ